MRVFKKRQSLVGPSNYRQWESWKEGDVLVGKLIGFGQDKYKKTTLKVKVLSASFKDRTEDNYIEKEITLNSTGSLEDTYEKLQEENSLNTIIQFVYNGKTPVKGGAFAGTMRHDISMDIGDMGDEYSTSESESAEVEDDL